MLTIKQAREAGASRGRWMAKEIVSGGGDPGVSTPDWFVTEYGEELFAELLDLDGTEDDWDVDEVVCAYAIAANDAFADVMSQYTKK